MFERSALELSLSVVRACNPAWARFSEKYIMVLPSQRRNIVLMFVTMLGDFALSAHASLDPVGQ